jgi:predicted neuraminidase
VYFSRSTNHGHDWTKPEPSRFFNPNAQTALCCTSKGKVILVLNNLPKGRHWLAYSVSDDGGHTWAPLETIDGKEDGTTAGKEYSYPSIIELTDGQLLVSYTWNREQIWWARFRP